MKNRVRLKRPERVKDYGGQLICGKVALDFALKAKEVVSSWDMSLAIPCDGLGVYLQTLRVGLPALLVVVQIQQAEVVGVFLTLEAGCLLQEQHHCPPPRKLLADGLGGFEDTLSVC